jgi:ribosomal protein S18 acetylase RimI-like enzyme
MSAIGFRQAVAEDSAALGALHLASWRETYAGILPEPLLAALSADERAAMWRAVLENPGLFGGGTIFVAEAEHGIVGFGACGAQRDAGLNAQGFDGEIGAVYVLEAHQGAGVGASLMRLMAARLLDQGRTAASLWVLSDNRPARAFYERLGGVPVGEKREEQAGAVLTEVAYGWSDLAGLARRQG